MSISVLIVIPARYASSRLPGKPLISLAGQSMLQRVVSIAQKAVDGLSHADIVVSTDDERIQQHCETLKVRCCMTPADCISGTDRVAQTVTCLQSAHDFVLGLQGDAPFTPPHVLKALIVSYVQAPDLADVLTPVTQLTWAALDELKAHKQKTPFSGTTAVFHPETGQAYWFSKTILPAVRFEPIMRQASAYSPVYRHIGLYGYSRTMLHRFKALNQGHYETLEGLEQLRLLEAGYHIRCIPVSVEGYPAMSGIDSPEDVKRAEALLMHSAIP